jgi:hypothetical protein
MTDVKLIEIDFFYKKKNVDKYRMIGGLARLVW